nr:type I inositol polyphosphate 5-phosphatase 4 isoform X1 [Tanacetum cinerariifolium]
MPFVSFSDRRIQAAECSNLSFGSYGEVEDQHVEADVASVRFSETRIFVATWNVARKLPKSSLNLEYWLHTSPPADIYVLGW